MVPKIIRTSGLRLHGYPDITPLKINASVTKICWMIFSLIKTMMATFSQFVSKGGQ
jgi:hypothetical protein